MKVVSFTFCETHVNLAAELCGTLRAHKTLSEGATGGVHTNAWTPTSLKGGLQTLFPHLMRTRCTGVLLDNQDIHDARQKQLSQRVCVKVMKDVIQP